MKTTHILKLAAAWLLLANVNLMLATAFAQGTAFSYQGRLNTNGVPATGLFDFQYYLRDALTAGSPVGTTNTLAPVGVTNGLFTVSLNFGAGIFTGAPRWLEMGVRTNGSVAAYTTLAPRTPLLATPYAITASNLTGTLPTAQLSGSLNAATLAGSVPPASLTAVPAASLTGTIADGQLSGNVALLNFFPQTFTSAKAFSAELAANNNIRLNGSNIWFLGGSDVNHGLGYYGNSKPFGGNTPDGPVLFGFGGGVLGSSSGGYHPVLTWTPQQVFINATNPGSWSSAVTFIENRSTNNINASPALRLQAAGNLVDGVLSVSSTTGTGYIARFGNASGYLFDITTNGTLQASGPINASSGVRVDRVNIWFTGDFNHGLGYYGNGRVFAGAQPDGPVLFGYSGGALGSEQYGTEKIALSWDANGNVTATNGPIKALGGLVIENRTNDPAGSVAGQIWLRTDL